MHGLRILANITNQTISANNSIVVPDWAVAILSAVGIFVCMCCVAYQAEGGRK
jgi:hypothetical protein